ncbi:MAG: hypothetical protein U5K43_07045 [Halofilum sp. (in: g-proteobacteria)]|nr:hypothetical protein [Halofilum sp. (in: g-proteobacteria)]
MQRLRLTFLLAIAVSAPAQAASDQPQPGDIDPAQVVQAVPGMPERGRTMQAVRARLGDPRQVVGPVGEPPITRWVYDEFTVYFEHERVLHSVKRRER